MPLLLYKKRSKVWSLGGKTQAHQNTAVTNDMSSDAYSWANSRPLQIDKYGNRFAIAQRDNGNNKYHTFTFANGDSGPWQDSTMFEQALARGTVGYDYINDIIHVLWYSTGLPGAGTVYRRYVFTRDGSNNITDIKSDSTIGTRTNLVMDNQSTIDYEHPIMMWFNDPAYGTYGAIVAVYGAHSATGNEIRASMCVLGATATRGQIAANWSAVVSSSSTTIGGGAPPVAYSALYSSVLTDIPYLGIARKNYGTNAKDLYLVYYNGANGYYYRRARWNSVSNNWSTGLTTPIIISPMQRSGTNTGYILKNQLITEPAEDIAGDKMHVGLSTWKSDALGDTWGYATIDSSDTITLTDTYSAGGAHSLYPTGDLSYCNSKNLLVVAYVNNIQDFSYIQLYKNNIAQGNPVALFDGAITDIPLLERSADYSGKVVCVLRDAINSPTPPYHGWYATLTWQ